MACAVVHHISYCPVLPRSNISRDVVRAGIVSGTMADMDDVAITGDTIKLGQLLKLANLIDQGADAKLLLVQDEVTVNGEVETRRGRQLVRGDVVAVNDVSVRVT